MIVAYEGGETRIAILHTSLRSKGCVSTGVATGRCVLSL